MTMRMMLDSGAFSAHTQKEEVDFDKYCAFCKKKGNKFVTYFNLDVINDGEASYQNWLEMRRRGLDPMPVYHALTDPKYLKWYMKECDYISVGAIAKMSTPERVLSLDRIWREHLTDSQGYPKVKVHGLGLTAMPIIFRYPWYSVDSSSWASTGRFGGVYVPRFRKREYIYDERSWVITVSTRASPAKAGLDTRNYSALTQAERKVVLDYITVMGYTLGRSEFRTENESYELKDNERWAGKAADGIRRVELLIEEGLSNVHTLRNEINLLYFLELERRMPKYPWKLNFKVDQTPLI